MQNYNLGYERVCLELGQKWMTIKTFDIVTS